MICRECNEDKAVDVFVKSKKICKPCWAAKQREWRKQNPEKYKVYTKRWRTKYPERQAASSKQWQENNPEKAKELADNYNSCRYYNKLERVYGLSIEEYNSLYERQNFKCAICEEVKDLFVDHNHVTNKVRGLLCSQCNSGLGFFMDSPTVIKRAEGYLTAHKE